MPALPHQKGFEVEALGLYTRKISACGLFMGFYGVSDLRSADKQFAPNMSMTTIPLH